MKDNYISQKKLTIIKDRIKNQQRNLAKGVYTSDMFSLCVVNPAKSTFLDNYLQNDLYLTNWKLCVCKIKINLPFFFYIYINVEIKKRKMALIWKKKRNRLKLLTIFRESIRNVLNNMLLPLESVKWYVRASVTSTSNSCFHTQQLERVPL